jgi:alpha-tubulin suppressor-like RCC1 family protein
MNLVNWNSLAGRSLCKTYSWSRKAAILLALGCLQCGGDAAGKVELDAAVQKEVDGTSRTSDLPLLEVSVLPDILVSDAPGSDLSDSMAPDVLDRSPTDTSDGSAADVFDTQATDISDMMGVDISDVPFLPPDGDGEGTSDALVVDTEIGDITVYDGPEFRLLAMAATNGCAVEGDNIWCWGSDLFLGYGIEEWSYGKKYDGTKLPVNLSPHIVATSESLAEVGVGKYQVCGLHEDGSILCWIGAVDEQGDIDYKFLDLSLPTGAESLSCDVDCCAAYESGTVACWRPKPGTGVAEIDWQEGLEDILVVSSGNAGSSAYACVLMSSGQVQCWGKNYSGLLGVETEETIVVDPVTVPLTKSVDFLDAGSSYTCAATSAGAVRCWGANGKWDEHDLQLEEGTSIVRLSTGYMGWCVVLSSGEPVCQLKHYEPGPKAWPEKVIVIVLAEMNGCLLDEHGATACWGSNTKGQLGQVTAGCPIKLTETPVVLSPATTVFDSGPAHSCAIDEFGLLDCWGYDEESQYEYAAAPHWPNLPSPFPDDDWASVSVGSDDIWCTYKEDPAICATTASGRLFCSPSCPAESLGTWTEVETDYLVAEVSCGIMGPDAFLSWGGAVFDASPWSPETPSAPLVTVAEGYSKVACEAYNCCATDSEAGTFCWGWRVPFGESDLPGEGEEFFPSLKGAEVVVAEAHACVLTPGGEVWCWGWNGGCQLGIPGSPGYTVTPTLVPLPASAVVIAAGLYHTCAGLEDGSLHCWGWLSSEQGLDTYWGPGPPDCGPTKVASFDQPLHILVADSDHTIAVEVNGKLWFSGCNHFGVVPGGSPTASTVPLPIALPQ